MNVQVSRWWITVFVVFVLLLCSAALLPAQTCNRVGSNGVTLEWNYVDTPELAGFHLYVAPESQSQSLDGTPHAFIGPQGRKWDSSIAQPAERLAEGQNWIVLTAINDVGNESLPSNEICVEIDTSSLPSPVLTFRVNTALLGPDGEVIAEESFEVKIPVKPVEQQ